MSQAHTAPSRARSRERRDWRRDGKCSDPKELLFFALHEIAGSGRRETWWGRLYLLLFEGIPVHFFEPWMGEDGLEAAAAGTHAFGSVPVEDLAKQVARVPVSEVCREDEWLLLDVEHGLLFEELVPGSLKWGHTEQHFVDGDAPAPNVDPVVVGSVGALFRTQVRIRPSNGQRSLAERQLSREAKIAHLDESPGVEEQVCWLHISVDYAALV
mmetsp:Transcript_27868/g.81596  ORF Transcript_27868/g.81596 Transcript_27868/m.81596 type:complete len:213 (+) Transcript_27868:312-950(+)